jgi:hypothetical protein
MKTHLLAALAAASMLAAPQAFAQDNTEVGLLECIVEGDVGLIITSSREVSCVFDGVDGGSEPYFGVINRYGLDIGQTSDAIMQWAVFAPSAAPYLPGSLAGNYVGASAEITAGIGGGANILVGGSDRTIALQPVSVQAQTGLNVALGVAEFQLRSAAQ